MLLHWASSSHENSVNQTWLPHAVIALNATEPSGVNQQEWETDFVTDMLMSNVAKAVDRDPQYYKLKQFWNGQGFRIESMQDLERYYSSITVVRIPVAGRYMMIDEQVTKLHDVMIRLCVRSYNAKRRSRMLLNSENLNIYLQCAFDHFSQNLPAPFNFMDMSFKINTISLDFGGHIFKLAVAMKAQYEDPQKLFDDLSQMVASCTLLDCVRRDLKGITGPQ